MQPRGPASRGPGGSRQPGRETPGRRVNIEIMCCALRLRQGLQAVQEHHEGKAVRDEVPVPERAPYGARGAGRQYVDIRVPLPVPLKPRNLVRRTRRNLSHGPVSLSGKRSTQQLSEITRYPPVGAVHRRYPIPPRSSSRPNAARRRRICDPENPSFPPTDTLSCWTRSCPAATVRRRVAHPDPA